jgi:integrase
LGYRGKIADLDTPMALTDTQARKALAGERDYKLADSGGLYLLVRRTGAKSWRMKYRIHGKEKLLTFGLYPEVGLKEARDRRDAARALIRDNRDPAIEKRKAKVQAAADAGETFEILARAWHEQEKGRWSPKHSEDVLDSLKNDVFPKIGRLPLKDIDTPLVLDTLRPVEDRGARETARRIRQRISAVFNLAIAQGKIGADPAGQSITKAMKPLPKKGKQPAITDIEKLRQLLTAAETSGARPVTKLASRLLALTAVRPGIIYGIPWTEFEGFDWDKLEVEPEAEPLWRIPAARMKLILERKDEEAFEHLVTLSPQAVDVILTIRRLTGRLPIVFPSQRHGHRPMSANAIGYLYNRVGYHGRHVPHGWRAAFSTIMNEKAEREERTGDRAIIDLMLAHVPKNKVEAAYNRAAFLPRRREIHEDWGALLMEGMPAARTLLDGVRRG